MSSFPAWGAGDASGAGAFNTMFRMDLLWPSQKTFDICFLSDPIIPLPMYFTAELYTHFLLLGLLLAIVAILGLLLAIVGLLLAIVGVLCW